MTTQALIGSGTLVELADSSSPNAFIPLGEVGDQDLASDSRRSTPPTCRADVARN
ncbi:MAG: hypothetical protein KIS90_05720 [Phenylobacterium sp.]|nr:hypothetical protein [Phenylobacterium sp.]